MKKLTIWMAGLMACGVLSVSADVWQDLRIYKMGDESNAPKALEDLAQKTPVADYGNLEKELIAVLKNKEGTEDGKRYACRMLQRVGSEKSVSVLSGLLHHDILSHYARLSLQEMDYKSADAALRDALSGAPDKLKPGILGSIGQRKDSKAVKEVAKLTASDNASVARAALITLGQIGGKDAAKALSKAEVSKALADAHEEGLILCADDLVARGNASDAAAIYSKVYSGNNDVQRVAALRGLVHADVDKASSTLIGLIKSDDSYMRRGAMRVLVIEPSGQLTKEVAGALGILSAAQQIEVIDALGERGDSAALAKIVPHLKSKNDDLRKMSVSAVGQLGNAEHVKVLLDAGGDDATAALVAMTAKGVDAQLAKLLQTDSRRGAVKVLAARGARSAAPQILKIISQGNTDDRKEAWSALASLASHAEMDAMMKAVTSIADAEERSHAEGALKRYCGNSRDKNKTFETAASYYDKAPESTQLFIIELASITGGANALALTRKGLATDDSDIREKSLRALAGWPEPSALPDLAKLAKDAPDKGDQIVALRGYIRIVGLDSNRKSSKEKVEMYRSATVLTQRADEKRLIASGLRKIKHPAALKMLDEYLDDESVRAEAEIAAMDLAWDIRKRHPVEVAAVSKKVMETSKNKGVVEKAKRNYRETKDRK